MSFPAMNEETVVIKITDPGADNKQIHAWRAPRACEVKNVYIAVQDAQAGTAGGSFTVQNWGTAGTAAAGTIAASLGGTAVADRLSAATPVAGTISEGTMAAGEWVVVDYQEDGDWIETQVTITMDVVYGVGAN